MISSSDFTCSLLGNWVLEHTQQTEEGTPRWWMPPERPVSNEQNSLAASARLSWPLARGYLAVSRAGSHGR